MSDGEQVKHHPTVLGSDLEAIKRQERETRKETSYLITMKLPKKK